MEEIQKRASQLQKQQEAQTALKAKIKVGCEVLRRNRLSLDFGYRSFLKFSKGLPCTTTIYNDLILFYANLNSPKCKLDPCDANLNSEERKLGSLCVEFSETQKVYLSGR